MRDLISSAEYLGSENLPEFLSSNKKYNDIFTFILGLTSTQSCTKKFGHISKIFLFVSYSVLGFLLE